MKTDLLKHYQAWLRQYLRSEKNMKKYRRMVEHFIAWTETDLVSEIGYPEIMDYIRHCQDEQRRPENINRYLRAVKLFFDFLSEQGSPYLNPIRDYNPAKDIRIKGVRHKIRPDYLDENELDQLYDKYPLAGSGRNAGKHKILLGLFVYQGLKVGEAEKLTRMHVDLRKGTLYVPKTIKGNRRDLKLATVQLYDLMEHMANLAHEVARYTSREVEGTSLLGYPLQNRSQRLCKELRQINPKVRNSSHLRGSRISYWVRNYDIREAQYLAGHLSVAGTEKYREVNLENLQDQIRKYHPLS